MIHKIVFGIVFLVSSLLVLADNPKTNIWEGSRAKIEYVDLGSGEYTLVIESGIGVGVGYWEPYFNDIEKLNVRTIIYSRSGNGLSQKTNDVTLSSSNKRLKSLLLDLNAGNNLILLGHSYGALHVRTFAATYSNIVKGIVLIDPSHEKFENRLLSLDKAWAQHDNDKLNIMMGSQPEWINLQKIYQEGYIQDHRITQKIPTIIVTSSKLNESDWWIGHSVNGKKLWRELHDSLINNNPRSVHFVLDSSGHNIPVENIKLTIKSIETAIYLAGGV